MKFVLATQELNYLMGKIQSVVSQRAATPILSHFLLEAKGNELVMTATDLTVTIQCRTEAKILEEGATALSMKNFANLVREITAMQVEVSVGENHMANIRAGESHFKLLGMAPHEFPHLPSMEGAHPCQVARNDFRDALYRTAFAVAKDDNRYVLTGVSIEIAQGMATFMGTDGKRLARARLPLALDPAFSAKYILPLKAVDEMLKNLAGDEEEISLFFLPDRIALQSGSIRLVTKLLAGDYPDVEQVIPKGAEIDITLDREELITLLRQINLFTSEKHQGVRFYFAEGVLHVDSTAMEMGEGNVNMPCNYHGTPFQVSFNPRYMQQILEHSGEEKMRIRLTDPYNPAIFLDEPKEGEEVVENPLFVLMPLRVD